MWRVVSGTHTLGFNVYRRAAGKMVRLNPSLIAGTALNSASSDLHYPADGFHWLDPVQAVPNLQYQLEAVGLDGASSWSKPVTAEPGCDAAPAPRSRLLSELDSTRHEIAPRSATTGQTEVPRALTALPNGDLNRQWTLAGTPAIKIRVAQTGWYRVTQPQLMAAGLDPAAAPRSLQLFAEGREVPIYVSGQNRARLGAADYIEFYGLAFDIATTATHVYWLASGAATALRVPVSPTLAPAANPITTFTSIIESKPRSIYFPAALNGDTENYYGPVISSQVVTQTLQVSGPALTGSLAGPITLEVALQGVTAVVHSVTVKLNGVTLGTVTFGGTKRQTVRLRVPATALHPGANTVTLTGSGAQTDVSLVDVIRLTYPRLLHAINNSLNFVASGGQTVQVTGLATVPVRVVDVTNPNAVMEITPQTQRVDAGRNITFRVPASGPRNLLAFVNGQFLQPAAIVRNNPSAWHLPTNRADLVVISHAAFMAAAAPLAAKRHEQGLEAQVVDVEDLYDEFTFGAHHPLALKSFLLRCKASWAKPPRFVLLLGDASLDPRNRQGQGDFDFVPTKLLDTAAVETASDDWVADFNNDGLPDMAVGRLPVRTAAQTADVIAKIIGYTGVPASGQGALLVSGTNRGYDFSGANARVAALLPPSLPVQKISQDDGDTATVHNRIVAAFNQGPLLVNFIGHGSVNIWTGAGLLSTSDAPTLTNAGRLPLVVCSNCLNGYFIDPVLQSLAEGLMLAPHGGAIAVWASSGETFPGDQEQMSHEFFRLMFQVPESSRPHTIGEAVAQAKAATSDLDVRRTWILFGDPSTPLAPIGAPALANAQALSQLETRAPFKGAPAQALPWWLLTPLLNPRSDNPMNPLAPRQVPAPSVRSPLASGS